MNSAELYDKYNEAEAELAWYDLDDPRYEQLNKEVQKLWEAYCAQCDWEEERGYII